MTRGKADDLDELFAQARVLTDADQHATERAVQSWRRSRRSSWRARLLLAVVSAAALGTVLMVQPDRPLPASAAYDVYREASGGGW